MIIGSRLLHTQDLLFSLRRIKTSYHLTNPASMNRTDIVVLPPSRPLRLRLLADLLASLTKWNARTPVLRGDSPMLFDKLWVQVKGAERSGTLTVEEALDCATRLPQALFCSMMECLAENGEDPEVVIAQVIRLHHHIIHHLQAVAAALRQRPLQGPH